MSDPAFKPGPIQSGSGFELKDTGKRQVFQTGAQRDAGPGKGFFHCIPYGPLLRLAQLYEAGARKYGRDNWKKGIPLSCYLDSTARHLFKLSDGQTDEDHAAAVAWNAFGFIWTAEEIAAGRLPRTLDDIGWLAALEQKASPSGREPEAPGRKEAQPKPPTSEA